MDRSPCQMFGPGWLPGGSAVFKVLWEECSWFCHGHNSHCGLGPEIFRQRSKVSHSDLPTVLIHAFARVTPSGGTGTSETISVRRHRRGCSPPLSRVLEVASDGAAVLDRWGNCRRWHRVQRACPSSKCSSRVRDEHSKSGSGIRI